jgi:hypothetical protein
VEGDYRTTELEINFKGGKIDEQVKHFLRHVTLPFAIFAFKDPT